MVPEGLGCDVELDSPCSLPLGAKHGLTKFRTGGGILVVPEGLNRLESFFGGSFRTRSLTTEECMPGGKTCTFLHWMRDVSAGNHTQSGWLRPGWRPSAGPAGCFRSGGP